MNAEEKCIWYKAHVNIAGSEIPTEEVFAEACGRLYGLLTDEGADPDTFVIRCHKFKTNFKISAFIRAKDD